MDNENKDSLTASTYMIKKSTCPFFPTMVEEMHRLHQEAVIANFKRGKPTYSYSQFSRFITFGITVPPVCEIIEDSIRCRVSPNVLAGTLVIHGPCGNDFQHDFRIQLYGRVHALGCNYTLRNGGTALGVFLPKVDVVEWPQLQASKLHESGTALASEIVSEPIGPFVPARLDAMPAAAPPYWPACLAGEAGESVLDTLSDLMPMGLSPWTPQQGDSLRAQTTSAKFDQSVSKEALSPSSAAHPLGANRSAYVMNELLALTEDVIGNVFEEPPCDGEPPRLSPTRRNVAASSGVNPQVQGEPMSNQKNPCVPKWQDPAGSWRCRCGTINRAGTYLCSSRSCHCFFCLYCGRTGHQARFCRLAAPTSAEKRPGAGTAANAAAIRKGQDVHAEWRCRCGHINKAGSNTCNRRGCRVYFCLKCGSLGHQSKFCAFSEFKGS